MRLRNICTGHFKHHYGGSITNYIFLEEFMDLSYANMYKFGFIFRNGSTNVKKSGKGVTVPCDTPIIHLGGGWALHYWFPLGLES